MKRGFLECIGDEWLLLADLSLLPPNNFMLKDAALAKEKVAFSERRCQKASVYIRAEILFFYPGNRSTCLCQVCTGTNCNCEYLRDPFFILRNRESFLENHKNLKRRPRDVTIVISANAGLFLEHILMALFSYILNGQ